MANLMEVLKRMAQNDEQEQSGDAFAMSALQKRFQPNMQDAATGIFNTGQAFAQPELYGKQPLNAQAAAQQRVVSDFSPLLAAAQVQSEMQKGQPNFNQVVQQAFLKQASGAPLDPQDSAVMNAWRSMGSQGVMQDAFGNLVPTNNRMPGAIAQPGMGSNPAAQIAPQFQGQPMGGQDIMSNVPFPAGTTEQAMGAGMGLGPKAQAKYQESYAGKSGENLAQGQADLPQASINAASMLKAIGDLENSPGLPKILGAQSYIPNFAGSDAADAQSKYDNIKGKTFLEAFQALKGGGQITEREGAAATDAFARLQQSQSIGEFKSALNDLKQIVQLGYERSQGRAGVAPSGANNIGNNDPLGLR